MFLDNHNADDAPGSSVLGLAFQSTSIAVFEDTLRSLTAAEDSITSLSGSLKIRRTEKTVTHRARGSAIFSDW